ncbi:MAG: hypothetical protein MR779_02110 [Tenericutes bacterium]|nr:hypothetical protein [Mycoplasmatota bacterium]
MTIEEFLIKIKSLKENNTPITIADFKTYVNLFNVLYISDKDIALSILDDLTNLNVFTESRPDYKEYSDLLDRLDELKSKKKNN